MEDAVKVSEVTYPLPNVVDTSNPVGADTTMFVGMLVPLTVKDCAVEAVPEQAVMAVKEVVLTVITGLKTVTDDVAWQPTLFV